MSIYNWIQEKLFDEYEEWRLKSPGSNGNGFNIVGIDNTLKAMHDGFYMYMGGIPTSCHRWMYSHESTCR